MSKKVTNGRSPAHDPGATPRLGAEAGANSVPFEWKGPKNVTEGWFADPELSVSTNLDLTHLKAPPANTTRLPPSPASNNGHFCPSCQQSFTQKRSLTRHLYAGRCRGPQDAETGSRGERHGEDKDPAGLKAGLDKRLAQERFEKSFADLTTALTASKPA